jgi:large subunit ribosomal protein L9
MGLQVILNESVPNLGSVGDLVEVADGYARNFLIPRNLAMLATTRNIKQLAHTKRVIDKKRANILDSAEGLATTLNEMSVTIAKQVGEEDKLFGSVTNRDIEDALNKEGVQVDRRNIVISEPIKSLGVFKVSIKLHASITAELKVWVVAE